MLKYFIRDFKFYLTHNINFISTTSVNEKWFYKGKYAPRTESKGLRKLKYLRDLDKEIDLKTDFSRPIDEIVDIPEYHTLPDILKSKYTYEFFERKLVFNKEIKDSITQLKLDKLENSLAVQIITSTYRIRVWKKIFFDNPRHFIMENALNKMIGRRNRDVEKLRQIDYKTFELLCNHFNWNYLMKEPRVYEPLEDEVTEYRREMVELKRKKLKRLQDDFNEMKKKFYEKKHEDLLKIQDDFVKFGLDIEKVYQDVLEERQKEMEAPFVAEQNDWFEKEKIYKDEYVKVREEKRIAREKLVRR